MFKYLAKYILQLYNPERKMLTLVYSLYVKDTLLILMKLTGNVKLGCRLEWLEL